MRFSLSLLPSVLRSRPARGRPIRPPHSRRSCRRTSTRMTAVSSSPRSPASAQRPLDWGRVANVRRGTSGYGLWCAGTQQYPTVVGPSTFFPTYPRLLRSGPAVARADHASPAPIPRQTSRTPGVGTVSIIEVWNASQSAASKYKRDDDYMCRPQRPRLHDDRAEATLPGMTIPNGGHGLRHLQVADVGHAGKRNTRCSAARGVLPFMGLVLLPHAHRWVPTTSSVFHWEDT